MSSVEGSQNAIVKMGSLGAWVKFNNSRPKDSSVFRAFLFSKSTTAGHRTTVVTDILHRQPSYSIHVKKVAMHYPPVKNIGCMPSNNGIHHSTFTHMYLLL